MRLSFPDIELSIKALKALSTKRLLTYKKKYFRTPFLTGLEDYVWDCECEDCKRKKDWNERYKSKYQAIKNILDTREHVEPKKRGKIK